MFSLYTRSLMLIKLFIVILRNICIRFDNVVMHFVNYTMNVLPIYFKDFVEKWNVGAQLYGNFIVYMTDWS